MSHQLLSEKDWTLLAVGSGHIELAEGTVIRYQGQVQDDLLYVHSGRLSVEKVLKPQRYQCCAWLLI
jgi:hypothetical protein